MMWFFFYWGGVYVVGLDVSSCRWVDVCVCDLVYFILKFYFVIWLLWERMNCNLWMYVFMEWVSVVV